MGDDSGRLEREEQICDRRCVSVSELNQLLRAIHRLVSTEVAARTDGPVLRIGHPYF